MMSDKYFSCIISITLSLISFLTMLSVDKLNGPIFFTLDVAYVKAPKPVVPVVYGLAEKTHNKVSYNTIIIDALNSDKLTELALLDLQTNEPPLPAAEIVNSQTVSLEKSNSIEEKVLEVHPVKKQIDQAELHCLALNNYFEARGESTRGQHAVANVVLNRVKHKGFPDTICGVVKQGGKTLYRCQFSWWCDQLSDEPKDISAWGKSIALATDVLQNQDNDITSGALWYHADYVSPYWRTSMNEGPTIGKHIFYSSKNRSKKTKTKNVETT